MVEPANAPKFAGPGLQPKSCVKSAIGSRETMGRFLRRYDADRQMLRSGRSTLSP